MRIIAQASKVYYTVFITPLDDLVVVFFIPEILFSYRRNVEHCRKIYGIKNEEVAKDTLSTLNKSLSYLYTSYYIREKCFLNTIY